MIICIIGHSASGKSTVQRKLIYHNIIPLVNYTTRPIRPNETNGIDYHFLTISEFETMIADQQFLEYKVFNGWYYGCSLKGIDYKNQDYSLIVTPSGFKDVQSELDEEYLKAFYINIDEHERLIRMAKRKDKIDEIFRRFKADENDFENFHLTKNLIELRETSTTKLVKRILHLTRGEQFEKS